MPVLHTLTYSRVIRATAPHVWRTLFEKATYEEWTAAFAPGSTYEGTWSQGAEIRFLGPSGNGIASIIETLRPNEHLTLKHIGMVSNGVVDVDSEAARSWAPSFERYTLVAEGDTTRLHVSAEVPAEHRNDMEASWPNALERLVSLCETSA